MTTETELDSLRQRMAQIQIDFAAVIEGLKNELHNQQIAHVGEVLELQQRLKDTSIQLSAARDAMAAMDEAGKRLEKALSNEAKSKP